MKTETRSYKLLNGQRSSDTSLANNVKDCGKKYGSYLSKLPVLVSIYANMIIRKIKGVDLFFQSKFY